MIPKDLKPIPGFPDYFAHKDGTIWSMKPPGNKAVKPKTPRRLKVRVDKHGRHTRICLSSNGKHIYKSVHHLILETFISPRPKGMWACHGIGGKYDNSLNNLYWATPSQNMGADKRRDRTDNSGERNSQVKLRNRDIYFIRLASDKNVPKKLLADAFNVCPASIYHIVTMRSWKHL